jgi:hypothetical protein
VNIERAKAIKGSVHFRWTVGMQVACGPLKDVISRSYQDSTFLVFGEYRDLRGEITVNGHTAEALPDLDHRGTLGELEALLETPGDHVSTHPYGKDNWIVARHMSDAERERRLGRPLRGLEGLDDNFGEGPTRADALFAAFTR